MFLRGAESFCKEKNMTIIYNNNKINVHVYEYV